MINFCTLFNIDYIDKGLVLYDSLLKSQSEFRLFILALDIETEKILKSENLFNVIIISLAEVLNDNLIKAKANRSFAEFCWTLTPVLIKFTIEKYKINSSLYIDSDLFFYKDISPLINEIKNSSSKNVIITEHRFPENNNKLLNKYGKYCVQFNYFTNDKSSLSVLNSWIFDTLTSTEYMIDGKLLGDQRYLEKWPRLFSNIHELVNLGGGVAPWNVIQYGFVSKEPLVLSQKNITFDLYFYHFQGIKFLPFNLINCNLTKQRRDIVLNVYKPYLKKIFSIRKKLKYDYGINFNKIITKTNNPLIFLYQKYISPFRFRHLSNIIYIND